MFVNPEFELYSGIDPCEANRLLFNSTYKLPTFVSIESAFSKLEHPYFDLVTIAVPPSFQLPTVKKLFDYVTPSVVLLEKPICGLSDDLDAFSTFIDAYSDNTVFLVNYQRNYLPVVAELSRLIASGNFGRLIHGNLFYGKGLLMNGSHYLSLLISLLGDIEDVDILRSQPCIYEFDQEVDSLLHFSNYPDAQVYSFSVGHYSRRMGEFDLIFENARVRWADTDEYVEIIYPLCESETNDTHLAYSGKRKKYPLQPSLFIPNVYTNISSYLRTLNKSPVTANQLCSFHHGLKTFKIVKSTLQQL